MNASFEAYAKQFSKGYDILTKEVHKIQKRVLGWKARRKRMSAMHSIANSLFGKTGVKKSAGEKYRTLSYEEQFALREKYRMRRNSRRKHIVFFGNGTFRAGYKGNAPVPTESKTRRTCEVPFSLGFNF